MIAGRQIRRLSNVPPPRTDLSLTAIVLSLILAMFAFTVSTSAWAQSPSPNVTTWHNDNYRTGQQLAETISVHRL